jgi:hypothetical protein
MNPPTDQLPAAWMGYASDSKKFCAVRVCCYCPDKAEAEKLAHPLPVSHGICPACYAAQSKAIIPDF